MWDTRKYGDTATVPRHLHDNIQRESLKRYSPPTSVKRLQVLR
jgi:hypothetical protein